MRKRGVLKGDPDLLLSTFPFLSSLFGLACFCLSPAGRCGCGAGDLGVRVGVGDLKLATCH